jgi:hypothetical protein
MLFGNGNFEMRLFDTQKEDLEQVQDFFSPFPETGKGLRLMIAIE